MLATVDFWLNSSCSGEPRVKLAVPETNNLAIITDTCLNQMLCINEARMNGINAYGFQERETVDCRFLEYDHLSCKTSFENWKQCF